MSSKDYITTAPVARRAIQALLNGEEPSGATPASCGGWWMVVVALLRMREQGGTAGVVQGVELLARRSPQFAQLIANLPRPSARSEAGQSIPPLPETARAILAHAAPCAPWLDAYVDFASQAAPMTPRSFHESAGLFLASLAVGRRMVYYHGLIPFYSNLYFLWIGPTTLYRKTAAVGIFANVLRRAGLHGFLLSEDLTPEALLDELTTDIPDTFARWTERQRGRWISQRAMAAQRGLVLDEASFLFDSLRRDHKANLLSLLLRLYDCPDELSDQTINRGQHVVERPSLSFFGITSPAGMAPHFRNEGLWGRGLWRRFALIVPDQQPVWDSRATVHEYPAALIDQLKQLHHLFPLPAARLREGSDGQARVELSGEVEPSGVVLEDGVAAAWDAYGKATSHDMLVGGGVDEMLHGSYGGLGAHAIKVAMLLAAMDTSALPVRVERRHFARALTIVEAWRRSLHTLWNAKEVAEEGRATDRLLAALAAAGPGGLTVRRLCQQLHLSAEQVRDVLGTLSLSGQVRGSTVRGANGRAIELWTVDRSEA